MNKAPLFLVLLVLLASLFGCTESNGTPTPPPILPTDLTQPARQALENFLVSLHLGRYDEASAFYGGSYEMMSSMNPHIDPKDQAALLKNACSTNGFMCLAWKSIELEQSLSDTEFIFNVQFQLADGSLFVQGPCCGATESEFPPISTFPFRVSAAPDGSLQVMDMVPYVP